MFAISWIFGAFWLMIAQISPALRKNPRGMFIPAMFICVTPQLITYDGPQPINILAAMCCIVLFVWQMKKKQKQLSEILDGENDALLLAV